jgi:hypothetical protein
MPADKASMVTALHCLSYFGEEPELIWCGRTVLLEIASMEGSVSARCLAVELQRNGPFCGEWLPYLVLRTMRLYAPDGQVVNPDTRYRALCQLGEQLKDVVHWSWTERGNLKVTALTLMLTRSIRLQVGHLMRMLVLNFPQMLRRAPQDGSVWYTTGPADHEPIRCSVTPEGRVVQHGEEAVGGTTGNRVHTQRELAQSLQRLVGVTAKVTYVHPHPRLARMVCLWAGRRRWKITRKNYKEQISARDRATGKRIRDKALSKWHSQSVTAATGLKAIRWGALRRIVGLTPWGEQLLFRLKHHAVSAYNPVSAGFHCPHPECVRKDRVGLHHIFWSCPAAGRLRQVLTRRWRSAGLRPVDLETAFFSLTVPGVSTGLLKTTGQILAGSMDDSAGQVGAAIETAVERCWRLGAALYFHSVWRWRVAFFDSHNDTSPEHHEACYATRLRNGYASVVRDLLQGRQTPVIARVGRALCDILNGSGSGPKGLPMPSGPTIIVFYAGRTNGTTEQGFSGVMIARFHKESGASRLLYTRGRKYPGKMTRAPLAMQLGVLQGLRTCRRHGWGPVHVTGNNHVMNRQHQTRTPPRETALKATYWAARRTADAVGVTSWTVMQREHTRTVHEIMRVVELTNTDMEWSASDGGHPRDRWAAVAASVVADARHWGQAADAGTQDRALEGVV